MEKRTTQSQKMKEYWARRKAAIARANVVPTEDIKVTTIRPIPTGPDYKKLYKTASEELKAANDKLAQYEGLIKSYATKAQNAETVLKKATLEYDARIKFILDSVRHCYTAIQLAAQAQSDKGGN